jgi:hypothetical protein
VLDVLTYTLARVRAALDLVSQLLTSEFPQPNCEEGIRRIGEMFEERKKLIESFRDDTNPDIVYTACHELLDRLFELLPVLGFLLRSTDVRNAFELHAPLARLARKLVPDVKLVLSSEWDFSPFTFPEMASLPGYVLIGLPASESANGLALPLAGHELGHAVWSNKGLGHDINPRVVQVLLNEIRGRWDEYTNQFPDVTREALEDLSGARTWAPAYRWATSQSAEFFCDQFGVRVFGESYLHAFAYLLAPGLAARNPAYPANRRRAENLVAACSRWDLTLPDGYVENFRDWPTSLDGSAALLCSLADGTANALTEELLDRCDSIANDAGVLRQDREEVTRIVDAFRKLIPGTGAKSLSSITNAGWHAYRDPGLWSNYPHIRDRKSAVLNELVLKTIEVFEIETVLQRS